MLQHDVDDTATRKSDQGKAWPPNTPCAREAEDDIPQQTPTPENNTRGLGEQMHCNKEATQKCTQRHTSQPPNTNSMGDTREDTAHMTSKVSLMSNFKPRKSRLGLAEMETPDRKDQVKMGRVHNPGSINH